MSIRQEVLFKIKSVALDKIDSPEKVSGYFGENTFGIPCSVTTCLKGGADPA